MKKKTKKGKKLAYREQDFNTYVLWKSLPSLLRGKSAMELSSLGIKDEIAVELLTIRNQNEFAEKYKISQVAILSRWNKKIEENNLIRQNITWWAKKLTPNVVSGLYKGAVSKGSAAEAKLWFQYIEDWSEKTLIEPTGEGLKELTDIFRKLAGK